MDFRTARDGQRFEYWMIIRTHDRDHLARLAQSLVGLQEAAVFRLHRSGA